MFKKLLYINLFSITFLALFNYLVFHNLNSKAYLESFTVYNQRINDLAFQNIDRQIMEAATEIPQLYFSDMKQNEDLLLPQEEDVMGSPAGIRGLVNQMEEIKKFYSYVKSMDVYYEGTQTVVTGFNLVHHIASDEEIKKYLPWYEEFQKTGKLNAFLESSHGIYPTGEPVITYASRISRSKWKDRGIVVAIHISPESLKEYMDEEGGTLMVTTPSGKILYLTKGRDYKEAGLVENDVKKQEEKEKKLVTLLPVHLDSGETTVFHSGFQRTGLEYYYYIQNNRLYADYNVQNRIFLMNFLLSIFFNLAILSVFSWFNHCAFKKRMSKASEEITTLNETVRSSRPLLLQNAVRSLILNRRMDQAYEQAAEYLQYDSVSTAVLYHPDLNGASDLVFRLQEELLNGNGSYHSLFTTMEKGEVAVILSFDAANMQLVYQDFQKRLFAVAEHCHLILGKAFELSKENIRNSYLNAAEIARYRFIYSDRLLLTDADVEIEKRKGSGSHLRLFEAIERDILSENFQDFQYHIEALTVSFQEGNYTVDYCMSTLRDLVSLLYQIMNQRQLDMWIIFGYDIREYYKQIESLEEFKIWMLDLCSILLENVRQKKQNVDTDLQAKLTALIDENLENEISLDFLCDRLDMRPDALSRQFKQVMGKGYTEYIKEKKMARVLELLAEDYSVKDIAGRMGYHSPQYFIKVFKEIYGLTPYQYKKQKLGKEEEV